MFLGSPLAEPPINAGIVVDHGLGVQGPPGRCITAPELSGPQINSMGSAVVELPRSLHESGYARRASLAPS